jgi:hypothetical protein
MALLFFLLMMWVLGVALWHVLTRRKDRAEAIKAFRKRPFYSLFMIAWIGSVTLFVVGVFAPVIGQVELYDTGWQLWQVGGVSALVGWVISWKLEW